MLEQCFIVCVQEMVLKRNPLFRNVYSLRIFKFRCIDFELKIHRTQSVNKTQHEYKPLDFVVFSMEKVESRSHSHY